MMHSACAGSGYVFDYNGACTTAYQQFLSLHMDEGRATVQNELKSNPGNLMATYIADYEDCIQLLISCDKVAFETSQDHMDQRLEQIEKGDHNNPWYRLCKSGIYLHWALINMRLGNLYHEAIYFRKSFVLLRENKELFPSFEYNAVFGGLQEAVAGSLPSNYRWLASLAGISGSVKKGTALLSDFVATHKSDQPLYAEAVLYHLFTRFYLVAEQKEVWDYLNSNRFSTQDNLLNTFAKVNIAIDYRKADVALQTLHAAASQAAFSKYAVFDFQTGVALLNKADTTCTWYFAQYLKKNKSELFIKDAWQKMAFAWYVAGDTRRANYCRSQISIQGTARLDPDKQASRFAESNIWPNRSLLHARLLIEGGNYPLALSILNSIDFASLTEPADKAEYFFRLGRVYEESGMSNKGLENYQLAINVGRGRHDQFAARAALHKGRIYELAGNRSQAIASYNECLDMPPHDFQNSIDNQAKAGLNRLGGK